MRVTPKETKTTKVVHYAVEGAPILPKRYAETIKFQPDSATVTVHDGKLVEIVVSGPRVLASGSFSIRKSERYSYYDLVPRAKDTPDWVHELAGRHL